MEESHWLVQHHEEWLQLAGWANQVGCDTKFLLKQLQRMHLSVHLLDGGWFLDG